MIHKSRTISKSFCSPSVIGLGDIPLLDGSIFSLLSGYLIFLVEAFMSVEIVC